MQPTSNLCGICFSAWIKRRERERERTEMRNICCLFFGVFYGHSICFGFWWALRVRACLLRCIVTVAHSLRFTHVEMVHIKPFLCSDQYFNRLKSDTMLFIIILISHSKFQFILLFSNYVLFTIVCVLWMERIIHWVIDKFSNFLILLKSLAHAQKLLSMHTNSGFEM